MAYAIHRHPHRHLTVHDQHLRHSSDGGWWKFGLAAAILTAVAIVLVTSPVLRRSQPTQALSTTAEPAVVFMAPVVTDLNPTVAASQTSAVEPGAVDSGQTNLASIAADKAIQPSLAAAAVAAPQTSPSIRDVNIATLPSLQSLASQVGGRIDPAQVKYADLTGDGNDEAVVPISSEGTAGNLALVVLTERNGSAETILTLQGSKGRQGLVPTFDGGQLAETSAAYGPTDANCCPSQIIKTYFRWDGSNLVVDRSNTINIPQGKAAD